MNIIRTFRIGGIHPEENKLTHEVETVVAPCQSKPYSHCRSISAPRPSPW